MEKSTIHMLGCSIMYNDAEYGFCESGGAFGIRALSDAGGI